MIISHFYKELNNQFSIMQQARIGNPGAGVFALFCFSAGFDYGVDDCFENIVPEVAEEPFQS
ncbi:MAG: hypothetical protein IKN56_00620, partial [Clostridia bacterium]|nr:hypothetical protein [Clostridia bacterium]